MSGVAPPTNNFYRFACAFIALSWSWIACAQTFNVDTTADTVDSVRGDDICADAKGNCSLRAAVLEANALGGDHLINVPAGTYTLSIEGGSEHLGETGDIDILANITIVGIDQKPNTTIIDGAGLDRVFEVVGDYANTAFHYLTIRNGNASMNILNYANGGGISVSGYKAFSTIENCIIRDNRATLVNFVDTHSSGGGIEVILARAIIRNTAIINNESGIRGGGIAVNMAGHAQILNSVISGNRTDGNGGGISTNNLGIELNNVTITANTADANNDGTGNGGGITSNYIGNIYVSNSLIAANTDAGGEAPDCSVDGVSSLGYNLIGNGAGCKVNVAEGLSLIHI